ncbi:hypothetical protein GCM10020001_093590 [Nonomuraea salmonea]
MMTRTPAHPTAAPQPTLSTRPSPAEPTTAGLGSCEIGRTAGREGALGSGAPPGAGGFAGVRTWGGVWIQGGGFLPGGGVLLINYGVWRALLPQDRYV